MNDHNRDYNKDAGNPMYDILHIPTGVYLHSVLVEVVAFYPHYHKRNRDGIMYILNYHTATPNKKELLLFKHYLGTLMGFKRVTGLDLSSCDASEFEPVDFE